MKIRVTPILIFALLGAAVAGKSDFCLSLLTAAGIHELGHLLAAKRLGIPLRSIRFDLLGAGLETEGRLLSYGEEWLLAAAGPLFSFLLPLFLYPFFRIDLLRQIAYLSFLLGTVNLFPIAGMDGGRMLNVFFLFFFGNRIAAGASLFFSLSALLFLFSVAAFSLLKTGNGLSLFCFSVGLFSKLISGSSEW